MSVYVIIQGSDGLSGFDITLKANHTIIKPADASLTGSLLSGGIIIDKCIGGILKSGPRCALTDTVDTLHFAAISALGSPLTFAPTTGLLFTAVYNVTGTINTTISFQTGCTQSSVNGTTTCVLIANGSLAPPFETVQTTTYTPAPTPTFTIGTSAANTEIGIRKGETGSSTIIVTSVNGFAGTVSLSTALTPTADHPPTISLSSSSVTLTNGGSATVVLTASARNNTTKLIYTVTVTGVAGSQSGSVGIQLIVFSG
jgi:hypothetical protein